MKKANLTSDSLFKNKYALHFLEIYRPLWALGHAGSLLSWDSETYMPSSGVEQRAVALSELKILERKLFLDKHFLQTIQKLKNQKRLNVFEKGLSRVVLRSLKIYQKVPEKVLKEFTKITEEAKPVWRNARANNDFKIFMPYLEKIFNFSREIADYLEYEKHPYDALLDLYEEETTVADFDRLFKKIIPVSKKILEKNRTIDDKIEALENKKYEKQKLEKINLEILSMLGFDNSRMRLDISTHPFTQEISLNDIRITTRYEGKNFKSTIFYCIHEFWHALYEIQIDPGLEFTPLASGVSYGVHESQSRFWENIVGRSRVFCELIYPLLAKELNFIREYTSEEIYNYFNLVKPGFIRVNADEVTYNLHIFLRYEIEKSILEEKISIKEIPAVWESKMQELLGLIPPSDTLGCLQDIHWSSGYIGYFPSYSLGTILAAQLKYAIEKDFNLDEAISSKNFEKIRSWLKEKIHSKGAVYPPKKLIRLSLKEKITSDYFENYLKKKYLVYKI
ncbi:MAG: carboxypeptidase M32 [archaeon]